MLSERQSVTTQDISKILENLRSQVAYIDKIVDSLIVDAQNLELPLSFASDQSTLVAKVSSLHSTSDKRNFIFGSVYDLIGETPSICDQINGFNTGLAKAVALAQRVEQLKRTTGIILNIDDAIKQADIQKEADAQYQAALVSAKDIQSKFTLLLQNGQISESKTIVDTIDQSITSILSAPALLRSAADRNSLAQELAKIKDEIRYDADTRLTLDAAHSLLSERLRQIKVKIMKIELKSRKNTDLSSVWSMQKKDIFTILNTKPGQDILRPVFSDWYSLLEYEQMINRMELVIDQLTLYNPS